MWAKVLTILSEKVIIPLAIKLGAFLYKKYQIEANEKLKYKLDEKKEALRKSIKEANDDVQIKNLSILLRDLDEL